MQRKNWWSLIGFLLFLTGMLSLILMLVGVQFTFMKWMDHFGRGAGFLLRILMVIVGMIIIYISNTREYKE